MVMSEYTVHSVFFLHARIIYYIQYIYYILDYSGRIQMFLTFQLVTM